MRKINSILLSFVAGAVILTALTPVQLHAQSGKKIKRNKVKSGIIENKISGMNKGSETIYFDDWGMLEAKYTQTVISMMGFKQKSNTLTLLDGEWTYNIDLDKKTGTKMKTPLMERLAKNAKNKDLTDVGKEMMQQMGGKKTGMEKVLGKLCEVWEIKSMGSKVWVWNGVALKSETNLGGMKMSKVAQTAKFNVAIPADKVKMPAGVTINEMPNLKMPGMNFK